MLLQVATGSERTSYLLISRTPEASSTWHGEDTAERVSYTRWIWFRAAPAQFQIIDQASVTARLIKLLTITITWPCTAHAIYHFFTLEDPHVATGTTPLAKVIR